MSLHPDIIAALMAAGGTPDMVLAVCRAAHEVELKAKIERRAPAAARQKRRRGRDLVDEMQEPQDEQKFIDAAIETESMSHESHVTECDKRNPHKENTSFVRTQEVNSGGGSACARTPSEAVDLLEELGRMAGFEPIDCPPGWCGGGHTIQKFFNQGCPRDVIVTAVRAELKRLSGAPPPERFGWFEKPIARAFANFQRAVPVVAVPKMEIIDGGKSNAGGGAWRDDGRSRNHGSATDAASDLRQYFARRAEAEQRETVGNDREPGGTIDGRLSS
jgi:hypothetical protein